MNESSCDARLADDQPRPSQHGPRLTRPAPVSRYIAASPLDTLTSLFSGNSSGSSSSAQAQDILKDPTTVAVISVGGGAALALVSVGVYRRFLKRIPNADSVTGSILARKPTISGVVTRVGDGDGFRLYHTPGPFWRPPLRLRRVPTTSKALKNQTLSIRIAGVDAPENAHFGNPAQPYAKEALEWLTRTVLGKRVKCQLLRKDQYGRIVAVPYLTRRFLPAKPLPLMMLREGTAVVYESGGGEYGPWGADRMKAIEEEARNARRGLWAAKKVELPSEYKRRVREGSPDSNIDGGDGATEVKGGKMSIWERLGRWLGRKT